ncbi:hypothetical protein [Aneurinibacillus tyrosinisolvens]|uniref:hypothetical protein n=1 Tax=Aneurinibacillus tyrosinisolvens TaxID=1443435 RepID=UPI00063FAB55|nr:hypothetical protein [Aneurinibacillus tyrosinisolvens]
MEASTSNVMLTKGKAGVKGWLILAMCLVYLLYFFLDSYIVKQLLVVMAIVVFITSLLTAKTVPRYFSMVMFILGVAFNLLKENSWEEIMNGITSNLPLLTLVILVPLLSIPLKIGGYFGSIHYYMERLGKLPQRMFASISFFIFCMGPILNLGSIRVLHEMIADLKLDSKLLAKAYLIGFSTVILWSPYFASVAMVLFQLHVSIYVYIPLGLSLAFVQLVIGNVLFWLGTRNIEPPIEMESEEHSEEKEVHRKKLRGLLWILLTLMGTIFLIEHWTGWPMLVLVSLIAISFPVVWCSWKRKWNQVHPHAEDFKIHATSAMNNEIVLFISAGLFGKSLVGTHFASGIRTFFYELSMTSFLLFCIAIFTIILVTTFIGIHQIVTVTVLISQVDPIQIGTTPEVLALLFMISWSASSVASPVNPLNLLVSGSVKRPALQVGIMWNGAYLLSMFVVGCLFVYFLH